jgi:hypothetical protein
MALGRPKTGKAKQVVAVRLDREMADELRRLSPDNLSGAIVAAIAEWLKRERRKAPKPNPHLASATAREIAATEDQ